MNTLNKEIKNRNARLFYKLRAQAGGSGIPMEKTILKVLEASVNKG